MRVVVADDQYIFAEAAAALLARNGHEVLGCHATLGDPAAREALGSAEVLLVGLDAEGRHCQTIAGIAQAEDGVAIVAMSESADASLLAGALDCGADAVFVKTEGVDELERLLAELLERRAAAAPGSRLPKLWSRGASSAARRSSGISGVPSVTSREREVLAGLARGESTSSIARRLGVGTATVRTHVQNLFYKFGTHSRLELLAQARRMGVLTSPPAASASAMAPPRSRERDGGNGATFPGSGPHPQRRPA